MQNLSIRVFKNIKYLDSLYKCCDFFIDLVLKWSSKLYLEIRGKSKCINSGLGLKNEKNKQTNKLV